MSTEPPRDPALAAPADDSARVPPDQGPWRRSLYDAPQRPSTNAEMLAPPFAFLGGAAAWALHLMVSYAISEIACKSDRLAGSLWGLGTPEVLGIAATVAAGLTAVGALVVALSLAPLGSDPMERPGNVERPGRERYLAFSGLIMNLLFTLAIVAQGLPFLFLQTCTP